MTEDMIEFSSPEGTLFGPGAEDIGERFEAVITALDDMVFEGALDDLQKLDTAADAAALLVLRELWFTARDGPATAKQRVSADAFRKAGIIVGAPEGSAAIRFAKALWRLLRHDKLPLEACTALLDGAKTLMVTGDPCPARRDVDRALRICGLEYCGV